MIYYFDKELIVEQSNDNQFIQLNINNEIEYQRIFNEKEIHIDIINLFGWMLNQFDFED